MGGEFVPYEDDIGMMYVDMDRTFRLYNGHLIKPLAITTVEGTALCMNHVRLISLSHLEWRE